jgi:hypothetical protein
MKAPVRSVGLGVLVLALAFGGVAFAQVTTTTSAGSTRQTFVTTTSASATCVNPPGPCGALVSLPIDLRFTSLLTITFSARGVVSQPTTAVVETQLSCDIDGTPCQPDTNSVEFLYPNFCCDTRSFTWVVHSASTGPHTVTISWTTANTGTSLISNRSLVVQAALLR